MIHFDTLEYTKGAEAIGIKREHAEYAAKSMASVYKKFNDEAVTKSYLSKELESLAERLESRLIIKLGSIMGIYSGIIIAILGFVLKH